MREEAAHTLLVCTLLPWFGVERDLEKRHDGGQHVSMLDGPDVRRKVFLITCTSHIWNMAIGNVIPESFLDQIERVEDGHVGFCGGLYEILLAWMFEDLPDCGSQHGRIHREINFHVNNL